MGACGGSGGREEEASGVGGAIHTGSRRGRTLDLTTSRAGIAAHSPPRHIRALAPFITPFPRPRTTPAAGPLFPLHASPPPSPIPLSLRTHPVSPPTAARPPLSPATQQLTQGPFPLPSAPHFQPLSRTWNLQPATSARPPPPSTLRLRPSPVAIRSFSPPPCLLASKPPGTHRRTSPQRSQERVLSLPVCRHPPSHVPICPPPQSGALRRTEYRLRV